MISEAANQSGACIRAAGDGVRRGGESKEGGGSRGGGSGDAGSAAARCARMRCESDDGEASGNGADHVAAEDDNDADGNGDVKDAPPSRSRRNAAAEEVARTATGCMAKDCSWELKLVAGPSRAASDPLSRIA